MTTVLIWFIAACAIGGVIFRPRAWPEAVWAGVGAVLLVGLRLLPLPTAWHAIAKGTDVYLFLSGMMLLAELARREGVFDWLASLAVRASNGSRARLFGLVYCVGILVTVCLSNDATAVVLTPAVYVAVKRAHVEALPYLFTCAFIANAASFVLPFSNPANLIVYGKNLPPLLPWLKLFLLPSILAIAATYLMLRFLSRESLEGEMESDFAIATLSTHGHRAAWSIFITGVILVAVSFFGLRLGLPTCLAALAAVFIATGAKRHAVREVIGAVSWSVLPLVAALFVIVEALSGAGALRATGEGLRTLATLQPFPGSLAASFSVAALSNVMNNLPSGLLTGVALQAWSFPNHLHHAVLIGVDLGPNLSVTGSLATVLWLIALRREGEPVSGWQFLKTGMLVMPPALVLATLAVSFTAK